jgi:hypothetical protein
VHVFSTSDLRVCRGITKNKTTNGVYTPMTQRVGGYIN